MGQLPEYPFRLHPCWSDCRKNVWHRIHLPVAGYCNVRCRYCDGISGNSCHVSVPGRASRVMTPEDAVHRVHDELEVNSALRIIAVSGPGEPLACPATIDVFRMLQGLRPDIEFCLSTNGLLLADMSAQLADLGIRTVSVTVNGITPETLSLLYRYATIEGRVLKGLEMGEQIARRQSEGIWSAKRQGMYVKVNTVLVPRVNDHEIELLAAEISRAGADLHNIVPLVPNAEFSRMSRPSQSDIDRARQISGKYLRQFQHCAQCRSDVVGVPGDDRVL